MHRAELFLLWQVAAVDDRSMVIHVVIISTNSVALLALKVIPVVVGVILRPADTSSVSSGGSGSGRERSRGDRRRGRGRRCGGALGRAVRVG